MTISLDSAAIGRGLGAAIPPLTVTIAEGQPTVIAVETDERPMLVSMLIGGRVRAESGRVTIDGHDDAHELRRATALVDTPFVSEPPAGVALATIVREELSFSSLPTSRRAVAEFLRSHELADYARLPVRSLPPTDRIRVFTELALLRAGVRCIVVTSPERHGADPSEWYATLSQIAERGVDVVIVTDALTRNFLLTLGAQDGSSPPADDAPQPDDSLESSQS
jgi:ABC-2 type transport system ATP-binding protein